jgi:hypothetical protein
LALQILIQRRQLPAYGGEQQQDCRDGEQELRDKIVAEESGEHKFGGYLLWSFLVLGGSILICSWQDLDPYGKERPIPAIKLIEAVFNSPAGQLGQQFRHVQSSVSNTGLLHRDANF